MRFILLFFTSLTILFSCNQNNMEYIQAKEPEYSEIEYASSFTIEKKETVTIIKVKSKQNEFTYYLSKDSISDNIIQIPLKKVICMSTTHTTYINSLSKSHTIQAISGTKYVNNNTLRNLIETNQIIEIGYESSLNFEQIININPDVIFVYDIGDGTSNAINKLKELGFKTINVTEFLENNPLAKAEWIKFFGAFFNADSKAEKIFNNTKNEYNSLLEKVKLIEKKPKVLSSIPWQNIWYIPGTKSYFHQLVSDAKGDYIINNNEETGSITMNFENVFANSLDADIWINLELVKSKAELKAIDERLCEIKAFKNNQIYNNDAQSNENGGNSYWEEGTIYPHLILRDLINIFHPGVLENDSLIYYRKME